MACYFRDRDSVCCHALVHVYLINPIAVCRGIEVLAVVCKIEYSVVDTVYRESFNKLAVKCILVYSPLDAVHRGVDILAV